MDATLTVLLYSSLAAAAAALGVLPLAFRERLPMAWIGWANALAAGLMLGAAYALMVRGLDREAWEGGAGAVLGIGLAYAMRALWGTQDLDLNRLQGTSPEYGYQVLLISALHKAPEGIAIGAAMFESIAFGGFMALAIAVHNIAEGTVLSAIFTSRGLERAQAAGLAVTSNLTQVLMAMVTFAILVAAPPVSPWALGFAVGGLIYLVMGELLPECYREAGHTSIALVTAVTMGIVVFFSGARF